MANGMLSHLPSHFRVFPNSGPGQSSGVVDLSGLGFYFENRTVVILWDDFNFGETTMMLGYQFSSAASLLDDLLKLGKFGTEDGTKKLSVSARHPGRRRAFSESDRPCRLERALRVLDTAVK